MTDLIPLFQMASGAIAEIGQLIGAPHDVHRLEELGLRSGAKVEMLQRGNPCIIRLAESKFCFRPSEAMGVLVRISNAS
jgi:Fe2+ transport system protein FeoA